MRLACLIVLALPSLPFPLVPQSAPTMVETAAWISTDLPHLAVAMREGARPSAFLAFKVTEASLTECTLSIHTKLTSALTSTESDSRIPMQHVDRAGIAVVDDDGVAKVLVIMQAGHPATFHGGQEADEPMQVAHIAVRSPTDAERVRKALDRAAELCGAKKSAF